MVDVTDDRLAAVMAGAAGIVFDKDGTLVDLDTRWHPFFTDLVDRIATRSASTSPAVESTTPAALAAKLAASLGLTETRLMADGPAAVESGAEINARLVAVLATHGHDAAAAEALVRYAAGSAEFGPVEPIGNIADALRSLARAGCRLGLATSDGAVNTFEELELLGLGRLLDPVCCADDGGPVKPDPAVLTGIAAAWNVQVSDIVFVGDSRQDLATARAAGVRFVARCDVGAVPLWASDEADAIVADIVALVPMTGATSMTGDAR